MTDVTTRRQTVIQNLIVIVIEDDELRPLTISSAVALEFGTSASTSLTSSTFSTSFLLLQQPFLLYGVVLMDHFWFCFEDGESGWGVEGDQEHVLVGHAG